MSRTKTTVSSPSEDKEEKRAERVLKRAKWMVYDGEDTIVVDHVRDGQKDLIFKGQIPVNVVGYNDIISTYPRLIKLVQEGKLRSVTQRVAKKMIDERKKHDWWDGKKDQPVVVGGRRMSKPQDSVQISKPTAQVGASPKQVFGKYNDQEVVVSGPPEQIDLAKDTSSNPKGMSMQELMRLIEQKEHADGIQRHHPNELQAETFSTIESLTKKLTEQRNQEEQKTVSASASASGSALDRLSKQGHALVDAAIGVLSAWEEFKTK